MPFQFGPPIVYNGRWAFLKAYQPVRPRHSGVRNSRFVAVAGRPMLYELTILGIKPNQLGPVLAILPDSVPAASKNGRLLGCFTCELGVLNRIAILAAYPDAHAIQAHRAALLDRGDLYGVTQHLASFDRATFQPFPFMSDLEPGAYGPFYE